MWTFFATTTLFAIVLSLAMFTFLVHPGRLGLRLRVVCFSFGGVFPLLGGGISELWFGHLEWLFRAKVGFIVDAEQLK